MSTCPSQSEDKDRTTATAPDCTRTAPERTAACRNRAVAGGLEEDVRQSLTTLTREERADTTPTLSFSSYDDLMDTLTPRVLDLIEVIRNEAPESINEAARVADRDVKNVHEELSELARLGIIYFEEEGQRKRPIVWFDELVIQLPFGSDSDDRIAALP